MGKPVEPTSDAVSILKRDGDAINAYFSHLRERYADAPPRLMESIEYSLLAGGKRLRPSLVMQCYRACVAQSPALQGRGTDRASQSPDPKGPGFASAIASAAAMELIHTFSLVHDDLPAMDDDDLRRGRLTNHKVYGEAMAILAGDAMTTLAFELIATDAEPDLAAALIRELAHATGPCGMIGGQVLDMDGEKQSLDLPGLQQIHRMKTGALLTTSCRLGAICARAAEATLAAVTDYGRHLGLAFQIVDDILDVTSTPDQLGKATNKDASKGKNTYPSLLGLDQSRAEAHRQLIAAIASLETLGPAADDLRHLAKFVVERNV
ncbi:MAG TPA: farnesyl diphosphate synthase [Tepidisphaeraceae bacterium]|nr:farnesyl diphosphate synthase [Tepidisphaeraceae bacterium]